jgi:protein-disulfide isomerase
MPASARAFCLSAVAALALAFLPGAALADSSPPTAATLEALMAKQPLPDVVEGDAGAAVTIIEYASLTCTHCFAFHKDVWPALKAKYLDTGKARFIIREFPLDPLSVGAFMLARCAGPQKREALIDRLFDHQGDWAFAANPLFKLKEQALAGGMSEDGFDACLKNQDLLDGVKKMHDVAAATLDVRSTPTFFINGDRLTGDHSLADFDKILAPLIH